MHRIKTTADFNIFSNVAFMIALMSNPYTIPYNLATKILHVILLYFIKDQYIIFALFITVKIQGSCYG